MFNRLIATTICVAVSLGLSTNIAFATSSLKVSTVNNQTEFNNLIPGISKSQTLIIKNTSDDNSALTLSSQLNNSFKENPAGSYDALKDSIQIRLTTSGGSSTQWSSLADWVNNSQAFPGDALKDGYEAKYNLEIMTRDDAEENAASKSLTGLTLTIFGEPATTTTNVSANSTDNAELNLGVLGTATNNIRVAPGAIKLTAEEPPEKPTPAVLGSATLGADTSIFSPNLIFLILGSGIGLLLILGGFRMCLHRKAPPTFS
ncbi:MAG: hypothetical protein NT141_01525 [candidate division WWE3 bacterium]|nr:hypothetical protein [candidate division WWE3 bacterium]